MIRCILNTVLSFCLLSSTYIFAAEVQSGLDVLDAENCASVKGKKAALLINANSVNAEGMFIADILKRDGITVKKIFTPEHGLSARLDENVKDSSLGAIPVVSLYGKRRDFRSGDLDGIDVLIFDIQDAGARYYTYLATLVYALRAARKADIAIMVLDRPNPVGGTIVSGFMPPLEKTGYYTSIYPVPTRHGMTIGELALYYNLHYKIAAPLTVVRMKGYGRSMLFSDTGLPWRNPSPNLQSEEAALLYSGIGWLETTSLSMARGLPRSFEMIGAPYINAEHFSRELSKSKGLAHVSISPVTFVPSAAGHKYQNKKCGGILIRITDKSNFDGFELSLSIYETLRRLYPSQFRPSGGTTVSAGIDIEQKIRLGHEALVRMAEADSKKFRHIRAEYLLYE